MKWLNGGDWSVVQRSVASGTEIWAVLPSPELSVKQQPSAGLQKHLAALSSARLYSKAPAQWWSEVGVPAGLKPSTVTHSGVRALLEGAAPVVRAIEACALPLDERSDADAIVKGLVELIKLNGPWTDVAGLFATGLLRDPVAPNEIPRGIELESFADELAMWCGYLADLDARPAGGHSRLVARRMVADAADALSEVTVHPKVVETSLVFDLAPLTLRAFVARSLFMLTGRPDRAVCKLCNESWAPVVKRGPTPLYCPEHQNSRSRHQFRRKLARSSILAI